MNFELDYPVLDYSGDENGRRVLTSSDWDFIFSSKEPFALKLCRSNVSDDDLARLENQKSLRAIDLSSTRITSAGIANLTKQPWIESLDLTDRKNPVTNSDLALLAELKNLKFLEINEWRSEISNKGLEYLVDLKRLEYLSVSGSGQITDKGLETIARIKSLQCLNLNAPFGQKCHYTDEGLLWLANLSHLRELDLSENENITDQSLSFLEKMKSIEIL